MKLVINSDVRKCIADIEKYMDEYDTVCKILGNPETDYPKALDAGARKMAVTESIVSACMRMLNHATEGKRYPHMTRFWPTKTRLKKKRDNAPIPLVEVFSER